MLGVRVTSGSTVTTRYFHTDNLGSIAVITDETGAVVERDGYDAWGKRRFPTGADDPTGSLTSQTTRGFTGQEELADVGLVHLNGRVYDPLIARMTSADPMVPDPMNGQAWNRYSYVINNPLAFTDPSGYCFLGLCGSIDHFFTRLFNEAGRILRQTPILGPIVELAATAACYAGPQVVVCAMAAASLSTTAVAGLESGNLGRGLMAGAIAVGQVIAFNAVGELTNGVAAAAGFDTSGPPPDSHVNPAVTGESYVFNAVAHAAVGCDAAVASGGKCGPSALAAGVTSAAGPAINGFDFYGNLVANAALGGGVAVLGGGKFENGAITSAFGYLFNSLGGSDRSSNNSSSGAVSDQLLGYASDPSEPGNDSRQDATDPSSRMQLADAANDNRTPQQICDLAVKMCTAAARMAPPSLQIKMANTILPGFQLDLGFQLGCRAIHR